MDSISKVLRRLMAERGLSAIELSGIAEVSHSTVSLYLSGQRGVRINSQAAATIEKLADALEVAPDDLGYEYRQYQVEQIMRRHPELIDAAYRAVVEGARVMDAVSGREGPLKRRSR